MAWDGEFAIDTGDDAGEWIINDDGTFGVGEECCCCEDLCIYCSGSGGRYIGITLSGVNLCSSCFGITADCVNLSPISGRVISGDSLDITTILAYTSFCTWGSNELYNLVVHFWGEVDPTCSDTPSSTRNYTGLFFELQALVTGHWHLLVYLTGAYPAMVFCGTSTGTTCGNAVITNEATCGWCCPTISRAGLAYGGVATISVCAKAPL